MKTFNPNTTVTIKILNASHFEFLIKYATLKNVPIFKGTLERSTLSQLDEYPYLGWYDDNLCGHYIRGHINISTEEFIEMCDNYWPNSFFDLNEEYTAEIHPLHKAIKVGCQIISFEKVRELSALLDKINPPT